MENSLNLDLSELVFAWQDDTQDNAYYLDIESGVVKLVNRNLLDLRDLTDEIEQDRHKFLYMPKPDKEQLILDLKEFWSTVQDDKLRNILSMAFESPHLLSSFRKILEGTPSELKRFEEYRQNKTKLRIEEWLSSHALKYELA
ncbi:MAG: hypothetical protein JST89_08095 [Cyanobacteria bacterium SZAS-4]|nr:hypothetical protein [Cyanobacteria bacterium SZAS-4]